MIVYLLLCLVSILAGFGILAALGLKIGQAQRWLLAPGACLVCWAIALGVGVSLGIPVRRLALPFWVATAVASVHGAWRARGGLPRDGGWPLLTAMALPVGLMVFDFSHGLANFISGPSPDGWSYVALGQQIWEMSKDTQGHFAPLYQYAYHLHLTRFISSAFLAMFSPLTGIAGDTQAAAGYFVAWSLFVFGASCAFVALNHLDRRSLLVFCALAVASRWVLGAVQIHNYDNLIAISFLPMTMGLVSILEIADWRAVISLGALFAATVYTYPEGAAFVGLGTGLALARRAWVDVRPGTWIVATGAAVALAALLLIPARGDLAWFISSQIGNVTAVPGARAGEGTFAELGSLRNWHAAVWGLESRVASLRLSVAWTLGAQALGAALWLLAFLGGAQLVRQRRWDVAAMGMLMIIGALFMSVHERYSYGSYKFLLLGWWIIAWSVVAGTRWLIGVSRARAAARPRLMHVVPAVVVTLLLLAVFGAVAGRIVVFEQRALATSIQPYRGVLDLERVIGRQPLILDVDDYLANEWAVYFLRGHPLLLLTYRGPMAYPHVVPLMQQAAAPDLQSIKYVLSDGPQPHAPGVVWRQGPYVLWRIPPSGAAFLRRVTNRNGVEQMNGRSFYWVGQGDTEVDILATSAGEAAFSGRFMRGPSLPDRADRRLLIGEAGETGKSVTITEDGNQSFSVPVHAGDNRIYIRPLDRPSVRITGASDTRPLLLGIEGLSVSLRPADAVTAAAGCRLEFSAGWYAKEPAGADWLRWSDGTGQLTVTSREPLDLVLQGEVLSSVRPNSVSVLASAGPVARWSIDDPVWTFHAFPPLAFHVDAGRKLVFRLASRADPVTQPSDARPRTIALKHVTLLRKDRAGACEVGDDPGAS